MYEKQKEQKGKDDQQLSSRIHASEAEGVPSARYIYVHLHRWKLNDQLHQMQKRSSLVTKIRSRLSANERPVHQMGGDVTISTYTADLRRSGSI